MQTSCCVNLYNISSLFVFELFMLYEWWWPAGQQAMSHIYLTVAANNQTKEEQNTFGVLSLFCHSRCWNVDPAISSSFWLGANRRVHHHQQQQQQQQQHKKKTKKFDFKMDGHCHHSSQCTHTYTNADAVWLKDKKSKLLHEFIWCRRPFCLFLCVCVVPPPPSVRFFFLILLLNHEIKIRAR